MIRPARVGGHHPRPGGGPPPAGARPSGSPTEEGRVDVSYDERTYTPRGAGWLAFSATMLVVSGVFKIFDALWVF